jgi:hypothetical protein
MHPARGLWALAISLSLAACGPSREGRPPAGEAPPPRPSSRVVRADDGWTDEPRLPPAPTPARPAPEGQDFAEEVKLLYRVVACVDTESLPPSIDARTVTAHCKDLGPRIEAYRAGYVATAKPFLAAIEPPGLPTSVVYPFGGGDLVTALTTYPEAREITTLSLELAGDPRRIRGMARESLERSLKRLRWQLGELFGGEEYSRSETLKKTQRGDIPGELAFFLVGLAVHGYEPVSLRYFTIRPDGSVHYLDDAAIADLERTDATHRKATWTPPDFSEAFANAEIGFRKRGAAGGLGAKPGSPGVPPSPTDEEVRIHRHIAQNLSDDRLKADPAALRHLERKGSVAAMTKAASYLLWNDAFSVIRGYLLRHAVFMVSDSTGVPPRFARAAGFSQETYGSFRSSLLRASREHNLDFKKLWDGQPRRKLPFRYGYLSGGAAHLLVTRKSSP